jgi:hypothetical protein
MSRRPCADSVPGQSIVKHRRRKALAAAAVAAIVVGLGAGIAQAAAPVTRVEEDWRVEFGTPDPETNAPQVTITISPSATLSGQYGVFELNHRTLPDYAAGGLQIQLWQGETPISYRSSSHTDVVHGDGDVVTFTTSMDVSGDNATFTVKNGNSQTWGTFSQSGWLNRTASCNWGNLDNYDPSASLINSRVGFASHRVRKLVRTAVRKYAGSDLVDNDTTEHVVHQYTEGQ